MQPAVEVDRLTISYGSLVAVREVSFDLIPGEILGLIGPNGSGKTSIVESVGGLRHAVRSGKISVCGHDPQRDRSSVSRLLGMQLQESQFPSRARVGEICDLYEAIYHAPGAAVQLLDTFGLADRRRSLISTLSGGMRQRLALALAQIGNVRVVVLDELTTGLDPEQRRETWRAVLDLAARGVAVLLTSHHMDEVEALCSRVGVLMEGELIALDSPAKLTATYGGPVTFTIDLPETRGTSPQLDKLGLTQLPGASNGRLEYTGTFPDDYNRIVQQLIEAGLPASAVSHRMPSLEDAYLRLVGAGTPRGVD